MSTRFRTWNWSSSCLPGAALEVHAGRAAPHADVGVVGFAGAVHTAAHHRDRDVVVGRVGRHLLHVLREFDELLQKCLGLVEVAASHLGQAHHVVGLRMIGLTHFQASSAADSS